MQERVKSDPFADYFFPTIFDYQRAIEASQHMRLVTD